MNLFKAIFGAPDHLANLTDEVNEHLSNAQDVLDVAAEFAASHDNTTSKTVNALTQAINSAVDKNNQVQAKAKELSALAAVIKTIVKP